ncbi:MAG: hypothetical protein ABSF71_23755, partial [Terriglobia bacterium]
VGPRSASPSPHAQDHASITFPIAPNSAWLPMPLSTDWGGYFYLDVPLRQKIILETSIRANN